MIGNIRKKYDRQSRGCYFFSEKDHPSTARSKKKSGRSRTSLDMDGTLDFDYHNLGATKKMHQLKNSM